MNEYQFVTHCRHEGTIKPVKSSGKHAGKWFCKVKGPKVDALGMNVKTLYTAPFIGAAKASIAKFLSINVTAVEVTSSLLNTPTNNAQLKADEFDTGDDNELANFDLNAAILSASRQSGKSYRVGSSANKKPSYPSNKQTLPPQYPLSTYKHSTSDAASNDLLRKELENLRAEKDRLNKEVFSAKEEADRIRQENERMTKEAQEVKNEKARLKGQIRAIREEHEKLQCDLKSTKQLQDEAEKSKHEREAEVNELDVQKRRLKGQIRALQEQRDELKCDIKSTAQKNENAAKEKHEKELKEVGAEKSKLKGQIRALQEQYDQLKSDIQTVTHKKDCAEKEVQAALAKKVEYDEEVKTIKMALDSHRKELASMSKKKQEAATKATASENEPLTKKQKTGKKVKGETIVKSMKVAELKEEALARGIDVKELAKANKDALLKMLVVGSPCMTKTDTWGEVITLRKTFADARQKAAELERQQRQKAAELERQRQEEIYRQQEQKRREQEKKRLEQREKNRAEEISKQGELHTLSVPKTVHGCKLACTKDLVIHGSPRSYSAACTECGGRYNIEYTCEKCDYDVCNKCFKEKTMTPAEKKAEAKRKAAQEKERQKAEAEWRRLQEEEEAKHRKKWDPKTHFAEKIVNPSDKNKDPDGNKSKGFTVWCSDGYGNDGWHSYEGAPAKEFDSTYATMKEANDRARYLFQWKNPWGYGAEEFNERWICSDKSTKTGLEICKEFRHYEHDVTNTSTKDGMITYTVTPVDSTTWTVSVVPDAAFAYLDNATKTRHRYDYDREATASSYGYSSFF